MAKLKIKNYYSKSFLNRNGHHNIASIGVEVYGEDSKWYNGNIHISDCNKKIILNLEFDSKNDLVNNIFKVESLEKELSGLKEYLLKNNDKFIENIKYNESL